MRRLLFIVILAMPQLTFAQANSKQKYEIVNKEVDTRGMVNHLDVYVAKMSDIKDVNKVLLTQYNKPGLMSLQILYYDNKIVAKTYGKKLFNANVSDNELTKMGHHVIGKFEYLALDKSQSLHIGKDADEF